MTTPEQLDPSRGLLRGGRAAVLTVPAVGFATLAHAAVDSCISVLAVALAAGVCWPAAVALLHRRRRLPSLIGWLVVAQLGTHVLLQQMCTDPPAGHVGLLGHLGLGLSPAMLAAHAGAVLLTALVLGRADAGLWTAKALLRAAARSRALLRRPLPRPVLELPRETARTRPDRVPVRTVWDVAPWVRRGPPVLPAR